MQIKRLTNKGETEQKLKFDQALGREPNLATPSSLNSLDRDISPA
jgi:hypothetical protein